MNIGDEAERIAALQALLNLMADTLRALCCFGIGWVCVAWVLT